MFNNKTKLPIHFEKVSFRRTKDGNKIAKLRLALPLDADTAISCPPEFRAAWEAIETRENKITYAEVEKKIPNVNLEFYSLPESKSISLALPSVELNHFAVEREETRDRCETRLLFSLEISVEEKQKLRHWLVDACFTQLFVKFEVAQMSLMPSTEESVQPSAIH